MKLMDNNGLLDVCVLVPVRHNSLVKFDRRGEGE